MTPDELEALSTHYAYSARVVHLSSGNLALFSGRNLIKIAYEFSREELAEASVESMHNYINSVQIERDRSHRPKLSADQLLKELKL